MSRKLLMVLPATLIIVTIGLLGVYVYVYAMPNEYYISGVSFVEQETNWCGPASLTMVLNYWGDPVNQSEIGCVVDPEHDGTDVWQMISFLESKGYVTYEFDRNSLEYRSSAMDELKMWVSHDYPVIVSQWMWFPGSVWHYRVVVGYDAEKIYVTDPFGSSITFSIETFSQLWDNNEYGLIVIGDPAKDSDGDQLTDYNEVLQNTDSFSYLQPTSIWIIAALWILAVVGTTLIVYFTKIKRTTKRVKQSNVKYLSIHVL